MVQHLYSDNGTNFVGADNPPSSRHNGQRGTSTLRSRPISAEEANVKSVKHHLKRIIADRRLIYGELTTVLISKEACLNSRPLCPLTADADDLEVLTPAYFLIGDSLHAPPEFRPQSRSFAEQFLIQKAMVRHFCKTWSRATPGDGCVGSSCHA
ncbi:uncharacterized protein LOC121529879 [Drosophila eugracilis]|uniref:uncharacterized protein LOC121529879 n=1 Tax=Drosophila eugracilis TaxID=29029 RepID=UPI001BD9F864|nr:uncharacterized protein LOC121529879 [Drosophila eugracilis]